MSKPKPFRKVVEGWMRQTALDMVECEVVNTQHLCTRRDVACQLHECKGCRKVRIVVESVEEER